MSETNEGGTAFRIAVGLAFMGGYADAASFLLAHTFTGHLTGNCILAAVSAAGQEWYLAIDRLLAVTVFLVGILFSLTLSRFIPVGIRRYSLAITMLIEVLLILGACLFLASWANHEPFIVCMCLALGIQNDALRKTNGISVHSTYVTGMVTTLMQKSFHYGLSERNPKEDSAKRSAGAAIQVLAPMWISFILGALAGALMVTSFHSIGLLGIVLLLIVLICAEMKQISAQPGSFGGKSR
jgi:uncharacterized membrane protein YoaK (UPF0700 family)